MSSSSEQADGDAFRRRVLLRRLTPEAVEASVEDHIHHFVVRVEHREGRVTALTGSAVRAPWSLCPGATGELDELVGTAVGPGVAAADPRTHCTHLLDIAVVAIRFAASSEAARHVDLDVRGWDRNERTATARCDDGRTLGWTVRGDTIVEPARYAGQRLGRGFSAWVAANLDEEEGELALLLRRATWISPSRGIDLDDFEHLSEVGPPPGTCYASQPERIALAVRNRGSSLPLLRNSPHVDEERRLS